MTWAGGTPTGPDVPGEGHPGIAVILTHVAPATGNGMSIQLPTLQSYVATGGDPKSGTVTATGPDNGWYTFSGTIAEEVRSEADGHIIAGEDGPLHQFTVKMACATYGQPTETPAPVDCDFDKAMRNMLNPGNTVPKPESTEQYAQENGRTVDELRGFFADVCQDNAFRKMAGGLGPISSTGADPVASTFESFLVRCGVLDMDKAVVKHIAADSQVLIDEAQAEVQKLHSTTSTRHRHEQRSASGTSPHQYPRPYSPYSTNTSPSGETTAP
jgi:hypothetical protein